MRNLVPQFILEKYAQGEAGGRFAAVSLFADISGFSAVTNILMQHDNEAAETMAGMMLAIFDPLVRHIHAHGGFITTFAGDAFTALFPITGASDSYTRALAAAVGIQRHMIANSTQSTPYGNFPFTIKLGLGDGEVDWGILRPQEGAAPPEEAEVKAAYFFSGSAIDAAAAAEHHAQSGNLILNPAVHARVESLVKAIPLGNDTPRHVRLLSADGLPAPLPPSPPGPHAALEEAFIPSTILQRATSGDFRQVVSVFVKLMGIETPQDLAIFMHSVFALQQQVGGYLNRVDFGDKGCTMLLYWGMPTSYENDIERALSFVLELSNYTPGTFRAGITYHPMYAGIAGSPDRGEYTCYGDGINLAARLMVDAPWGSIWLDDRMADHAGRAFALDFVGRREFKGFGEKQSVFALVERKQEGGGSGFQGQMVGRKAELARLDAFVQQLFAPPEAPRFAGILVVQGEPGTGKSRLASEFLTGETWGVAASCQVFMCQTDPVIRKPLNPFRYWLHAYFDQSTTRSETHNKRAFSRKLDQVITDVPDPELGKELNRVRSFLGALVNLYWDSSLYAQLDPQGRFENTMGALKTLLKAESLIRPVMLLLEDVQWLDDDSIEFFHRLIRNVDAYPLAVLATARPECEGMLFGEGTPYQQIDLDSLTPDDIRLLAVDRLGGPVEDALTDLLIERAECNPFFSEQILLFLQEQGTIALRDGEWRLIKDSPMSSLPADVRTLFVARLDRLEPRVGETVRTASVLGREFEVQVLARMLSDGDDIADRINAAEHEMIWLSLGSVRYRFTQSLLRDAAYEMQLRARRRELHELAAGAYEAHYAQDLAPHYDKIAYHYEAAYLQGAAKLRAQALAYLHKAGKQAAEVYENATAVDYYSRALALTPDTEVENRFELLLAREMVYHLQGARQLQTADLEALAQLAGTLKEPAKQAAVALRKAKLAFATGEYAESIAAAQHTVTVAQAAQDPATEVAGYVLWASALERTDDEEGARAQYMMALELARAAEDRRGEGDALRGLGIIAWNRSERAEAQQHYGQSLAITQELGDRRGEAATLNNLGLILNELGEYGEAQACYARALAIRRDIGDRAGEGSTLNNLGLLSQTLGNYTEARTYLQQSLEIWREVGSRPGEVVTMDNLGFVTRMLGEYDASRQYLVEALTMERALRARKAEGWTLNKLGSLYLALNDVTQAEAYFQEALALRRSADLAHYVAEDLAGLARVALVHGDVSGALAWIEEMWPILATNPTLDGAEQPMQALVTCYRVLQAAGDTRAAPLLTTLHTRLQERATKIPDPDSRRAFLENVPEHHELIQEFAGPRTVTLPAAPVIAPSPAPVQAPSGAYAGATAPAAAAPAPAPAAAAQPSTGAQPLVARLPLDGIEGTPPIVIVIENLTINVQNGPGIAMGKEMESTLADLLRQLLEKQR